MIKMPKSDISSHGTFEDAEVSPTRKDNQIDRSKLEHLSRAIKEITALYNIGVAVRSSLDLKKIIWTLYKESGQLVDTSNFALVIFDDEVKTLYFALVFDQGEKMKSLSVKPSNHDGLTSRVFTTQAPVLVRDLLKTKKTNNIIEVNRFRPDKPIRSWLGVPILNPLLPDEKAQGVIAIWSYAPNAFTDHDLWLLSTIGTQAAIAIRNARLYRSSQRRAAEMAVLNDVVRTLSSTLELDEVLIRIMEQVERLLNVGAGSVLLTDRATGDLVFQIALGEKSDAVKPFRVPRGQGIAGEVALSGKPLLVNNVEQDKRHFKELGQIIDFHPHNILCVPLILHDHIIGVLEVMNKKTGNFSQEDAELLSSIASYATVAIENARLHENVLAERDKVIEAQEAERKKLARDLHDGPTQWISSIIMSVDFCKQALEKDPQNAPTHLAKEFVNIEELADRSVRQLRTALFELRPLVLETQGLVAALQAFLKRRQSDIGDTTKLTLNVETINPSGDISRQDAKVEVTLFAIIQETMNNAIKYAEADNIVVGLKETPQTIYAVIKDDGQGFDVDQVMNNYEYRGSLGMVNLRERAELIGGELTLRSVPGKGTHVTVYVPKEEKARMKKRGVSGTLSLPPDMLPT